MSEEITKEDLLNMKLHEVKKINDRFIIMRVIGGWMYHHLNNSVFVPESIAPAEY